MNQEDGDSHEVLHQRAQVAEWDRIETMELGEMLFVLSVISPDMDGRTVLRRKEEEDVLGAARRATNSFVVPKGEGLPLLRPLQHLGGTQQGFRKEESWPHLFL